MDSQVAVGCTEHQGSSRPECLLAISEALFDMANSCHLHPSALLCQRDRKFGWTCSLGSKSGVEALQKGLLLSESLVRTSEHRPFCSLQFPCLISLSDKILSDKARRSRCLLDELEQVGVSVPVLTSNIIILLQVCQHLQLHSA